MDCHLEEVIVPMGVFLMLGWGLAAVDVLKILKV
jgi:hypothetical protein